MKLASKTIYGLQFLVSVAANRYEEYVQVKEIVASESISEKYLESIVGQLKKSGLLIVKRGAKGGYKLSKHPSQITMKDVVLILEGIEFLYDSGNLEKENATPNKLAVIDSVLKIEKLFSKSLDKITLENIVNERNNIMYYNNYQI